MTCACGCGKPTSGKVNSNTGLPSRFVRGHNETRGSKGLSGRHYNVKHGMETTPECRAYYAAKNRCTNPKNVSYKDYGARGIKFLFESFEQFFAEIGPRPAGKSLDRENNNGNYEPGNVRWATRGEQQRNKRSWARQ